MSSQITNLILKAAEAREATLPRMSSFADVANLIDFYLRPESDFSTGQNLFLGGV